jgi:hypothetical protein
MNHIPTPPALCCTPWGQADPTCTQIAEGILSISTPSHGGFWLSPERLKELPDYIARVKTFTGKPEWFEEDFDWCLVVLAFPELFDDCDRHSAYSIAATLHPGPFAEFQRRALQGLLR